jgi:hypothetical protein
LHKLLKEGGAAAAAALDSGSGATLLHSLLSCRNNGLMSFAGKLRRSIMFPAFLLLSAGFLPKALPNKSVESCNV